MTGRYNLAELRDMAESERANGIITSELWTDQVLALVDAVEAAHDPDRWDEFLAICRDRFDFGEPSVTGRERARALLTTAEIQERIADAQYVLDNADAYDVEARVDASRSKALNLNLLRYAARVEELERIEAQARRVEKVYEGLRTDESDGFFSLWSEDDLVRELHRLGDVLRESA